MDWTGYSEEVQGWVSDLQNRYKIGMEKCLEIAKKMKKLGEETQDEALIGLGKCCIAEVAQYKNEMEVFWKSAIESIEPLVNTEQWEEAAFANAMLAMQWDTLGNAPLAQDYYLQGLAICKEHKLGYEKPMIEYNMAILYQMYDKDETALNYLETCWQECLPMSENIQYRELAAVACVSLAQSNISIGNIEKAGYYLTWAREEQFRGCRSEFENIYHLLVEARYYDVLSDVEKRDEYIQKIEEKLNIELSLMYSFPALTDYCEMLLKIDKFKELNKVLTFMEKTVEDSGLVFMQRVYIHLKMEYYKKTGDREHFIENAERYYELSLKKEEEEKKIIGSMLNVRHDLEDVREKHKQMEEENRKLQEASETDGLTGIPNRACMNQTVEGLFEKALKEHYYMAAEMLDVDYFKEYNDNYGHQMGDGCLKAVADSVKKVADHGNIFCARYGGDEFMLLYQGYSPEEVKKLAEELRADMVSKEMEHKYSKSDTIVTVSQGIYCGMPKEGDRVWDFLQKADDMLYQVKRKSRNAVAVGTEDGVLTP